MKQSLPDILQKILAVKREEIAALKAGGKGEPNTAKPDQDLAPRGFLRALRESPLVPVVAEVKRRSPSEGALAREVDPARQAMRYQKGGAACMSVLADARFFGGSLEDMALARSAVGLPVLCKDFILDDIQLKRARAFGADAVLLIAAALEDLELRDLYQAARGRGMDVLLEVHRPGELDRVLNLNPRLLGVNNRDLRTLTVNPEHCLELRKLVPKGITLVAESGVSDQKQIRRLQQGGMDAFLIGTSLMKSPDPTALLASFTGKELYQW